MISDPIRIEVIFSVKYKVKLSIYEDLIDRFIDEVEAINSFVAGGVGEYAFSSYKENIGSKELLSIINKYILDDLDNISNYKIKIIRYT